MSVDIFFFLFDVSPAGAPGESLGIKCCSKIFSISSSKEMVSCVRVAQWLCHSYTLSITTQTGVAPCCKTGTLLWPAHYTTCCGMCIETCSIIWQKAESICRIYSECDKKCLHKRGKKSVWHSHMSDRKWNVDNQKNPGANNVFMFVCHALIHRIWRYEPWLR